MKNKFGEASLKPESFFNIFLDEWKKGIFSPFRIAFISENGS